MLFSLSPAILIYYRRIQTTPRLLSAKMSSSVCLNDPDLSLPEVYRVA